MERLSYVKYGWRCVLGAEVFYGLCLLYGNFLTGRAQELHQTLFELIPGFSWGSSLGIIAGAIYMFAVAWILAAYIVWMYNTSLE